jgi:hypothetical protein
MQPGLWSINVACRGDDERRRGFRKLYDNVEHWGIHHVQFCRQLRSYHHSVSIMKTVISCNLLDVQHLFKRALFQGEVSATTEAL